MGFCKRKNMTCDIANTDWETTCDSLGCFQGLTDHNEDEFITGIYDAATNGKKLAIGTKTNVTSFVLNFGDRSCLLFMGDIQPIDLRQFNFDEFTSIEINGNKFVKEHNNV